MFFFSTAVFFHDHSRIPRPQGKGEDISVTPCYHFHPLHRHLRISRAITTGSSPLRIVSSRTRTGKPLVSKRKSLTTRLLQILSKQLFCKRYVNGCIGGSSRFFCNCNSKTFDFKFNSIQYLW